MKIVLEPIDEIFAINKEDGEIWCKANHLDAKVKELEGELRNWPEDFKHENGNYSNTCFFCFNEFIGYKRRSVCRVCETTTNNNDKE